MAVCEVTMIVDVLGVLCFFIYHQLSPLNSPPRFTPSEYSSPSVLATRFRTALDNCQGFGLR